MAKTTTFVTADIMGCTQDLLAPQSSNRLVQVCATAPARPTPVRREEARSRTGGSGIVCITDGQTLADCRRTHRG